MNSEETGAKPAPGSVSVSSTGNQPSSIPSDVNESSGLIFTPASYVERLDLTRMFPVVQPLEVELGSGDGSFMAGYAASHPAINFIGVERLLGRLRKLDRKGARLNLLNLRLLRIEAAYCVEYLLPCESVSTIHIYFPDPWPKRKHRKHRLISPEFVESLVRALRDGGIVYLRTDDADYFNQMINVFSKTPAFREIATPSELCERTTDFERDFLSKGVSTLRAAYRR